MKKEIWLAGFGILGACALCCALPLIGGAAALGISAFLLTPAAVAGLALVFAVMGLVIYQRRKVKGSACLKTGCGCNSCSK